MLARRLFLGLLLSTLLGCGGRAAPPSEPNPLAAPPVDTARVRSVEEAAGWGYRRQAEADLDGDARLERIVVASDVTLRGETPLWEDGHRWAVYVESASGERTLVYAAFVPRGFAEVAVLMPDDRGKRRLLVQERSPSQLRSLEIEYDGPGQARSSSAAYYQTESWLPGSAALP